MSEPSNYLSAFLADDPAVAALIGDRIYPNQVPQQHPNSLEVMPCAVFQLAGGERQAIFCGTDGTVGAQYQLDIYGTDRDEIPPIARAIRRRLRDYSGLMGEARIYKVSLDSEFDVGPEPEPGLYRRTQLYTIWHWED